MPLLTTVGERGSKFRAPVDCSPQQKRQRKERVNADMMTGDEGEWQGGVAGRCGYLGTPV